MTEGAIIEMDDQPTYMVVSDIALFIALATSSKPFVIWRGQSWGITAVSIEQDIHDDGHVGTMHVVAHLKGHHTEGFWVKKIVSDELAVEVIHG